MGATRGELEQRLLKIENKRYKSLMLYFRKIYGQNKKIELNQKLLSRLENCFRASCDVINDRDERRMKKFEDEMDPFWDDEEYV